MRIKKRIVAVLVIFVMITARIVYVNTTYKKPVTYHDELEESFSYREVFEVKVNSIKAYPKNDWIQKLTELKVDGTDRDNEYIALLIDYSVTNMSDTMTTFDNGSIYAQIGSSYNGMEYSLSDKLNHKEGSTYELQAGQSRNLKQVYIINTDSANAKKMLSEKIKVQFCEYEGIHVVSE